MGDPAAAELELQALVQEWELAIDENPSPDAKIALGRSLQALGIVERQLGKANEAIRHLTRACELLRGDPGLTDAREALALCLQDLGQLERSEEILRDVIKAREEQSSNSLSLIDSLDHLALNLLQQGRYTEVGALLDQALDATPADQFVRRARILSHRGRLRHTLGSHAKAIEDCSAAQELGREDPELSLSIRSQRALSLLRLGHSVEGEAETRAVADVARELFHSDPIKALPYINNQGTLALSQGDPEEGKAAFSEALEIATTRLGPEHPALITHFNNLGTAEQMLGDYPAADEALQRALRLQRQLHGDGAHLRTAEILRNLARNALLMESNDSRERVDAATRSGLELLEELVLHGSERDRLNFLERFDLVSLPCIEGDAIAIANVLLASKGRLLDSMLGGLSQEPLPDWTQIQNALPPNSAFIDACRFQPLDSELGPQYGAILVTPTDLPQWIPLGSESQLLDWLSVMRERLVWQSAVIAGDQEVKAPALTLQIILKGLENEFWEPVARLLSPEVDHVAFSPDGALHFLPLAALLDSEGKPLCHRLHQVTRVASGRDLTRTSVLKRMDSAPWTVLTISDFPSPESPPEPHTLQAILSDLEPMPGTSREADSLRRLAPKDSLFLQGREVTEERMASLPDTNSVLHLGCHAFYTGPDAPSSSTALDFDESAELLRSSGLVLYRGARWDLQLPETGDDLLFPEEIAELDLKGTRLVTLSSCDSGAGTPVNGEGLLGLQRAFIQAGASEVAVALWPVSDQSTPAFMERFYQLALHSERIGQALWQTQSEYLPKATDADFEASVLRYAPFNLSQTGPLQGGDKIDLEPLKSHRPTWPFLVLVMVAAVAARWLTKRLLRQARKDIKR